MAVYRNRSREVAERLIKLRDYLYVNATPTHAVKAKDMLAYLESEEHEIEIKTLYSDLETLRLFLNTEITYDKHQKGYILANPDFEPYELRMIVNSIQAAKFITQQEADRLTEKVMKLADKYTRPSLNRQTYIPNRVRTINAEAMKGLDTIYEAIAQNRKISYKYFKYTINDYNKTKEYQRADNSKIITASPYSVSWEGGKFYIYALREATEDIFEEQYAENLDEETADSIEIIKDTQLYVHCFLELEYMEQIKVLPDKREGNDIAKKQLEFESQESTGGKTKLKVSNQYISDVVSKFGHTAIITPVDEEFFIATIDEPPSPELYMWTHTLFPFAEIIYPENAENKLKSYFSKLSKGDELMLPYFLYSNQEMEKLLFT